MLRYKTETRPGLVALYDIQSGNGAGHFLHPRARMGHDRQKFMFHGLAYSKQTFQQNTTSRSTQPSTLRGTVNEYQLSS